MKFEPVHLSEALGGRVSQSFLRYYERCPRAGWLYREHGSAQTREMVRGSAFHAIAERSVRLMLEHGEASIPPEIVKVVTDEVLAEMPVSFEDHDLVREMAYRWSAEVTIDPSAVVACETLFVLDAGGYQVRAKVDFAEVREDGAALVIRDWKTSRAAPAYDAISRKRPDGSLAGTNMQLIVYALVMVFGVPVRVEDGVETPEPFSVASQAQRVAMEFVFPGIEDREGRMLRRPVSLTRLELIEYRASLEGLLTRVAASEASGDWPAIVSDAACSECPAASLCPIPAELRDHRGTVNSMEDAVEAAQVLDREKAEHRARQTELRNFAKAHGGEIRFGRKVWRLEYSEYESIPDKDGLLEAVDRAVRYGEEFDRAQFVKVKGRTDFKARDLSEDEINEGEANGNGSDSERSRDERFGSDAPF